MVGGVLLLVCALAALFLLMSIPFVKLLAMLLDRRISGLEFALCLSVLAGLFVGIVAGGGSALSLLLCIVYVALCIAYPLFLRASDRREGQRLDDEEIQRLRRELDLNPNNAAVLERLGDTYLAKGWYDAAIQHYQRSMELWKDPRLEYRLRLAMERKQLAGAENVVCPSCAAINPVGTRHCLECNCAISGGTALLDYFRTRGGRRGVLVVTAISLASGVMLLVLPGTPPLYIGLCFFYAIAGAMLYLRSRRQ